MGTLKLLQMSNLLRSMHDPDDLYIKQDPQDQVDESLCEWVSSLVTVRSNSSEALASYLLKTGS